LTKHENEIPSELFAGCEISAIDAIDCTFTIHRIDEMCGMKINGIFSGCVNHKILYDRRPELLGAGEIVKGEALGFEIKFRPIPDWATIYFGGSIISDSSSKCERTKEDMFKDIALNLFSPSVLLIN
jgi:hypothetical protein